MLISVFSPKGGSGTTVASALFAKCLSNYSPTLLIETNEGDLEAVLGADENPIFSFSDWANSPEPTPQSLRKIAVNVLPNLDYVAGRISKGNPEDLGTEVHPRLFEIESNIYLAGVLSRVEGHCVVDCSLANNELAINIAQSSDIVVIVLRRCYLGLWRAMNHRLMEMADVCVVVDEQGRSISVSQIADTLHVSAVIELEARRDFARTIDAGVLLHRTPDKLIEPIWAYVHDMIEESYIQSDDADDENFSRNDVFTETRSRNNEDFWQDSNPRPQRGTSAQPERFVVSGTYSKHARSMLKDRK